MKSRHVKSALRALSLTCAVAACVTVAADNSTAQQGGPPVPVERPDPFADMRERRQREAALRSAEIAPGRIKNDPRRARIGVAQVREDYKRLQVIRNEMVRALTSGGRLDYRRIAAGTAEVNKRASRLKNALALQSDDDAKSRTGAVELDDKRLKDALVNLCNGIIGFVEHPIFKSQGVLDVQETTGAGRLLQNIIDLSDGIRKSAAKLGKTD